MKKIFLIILVCLCSCSKMIEQDKIFKDVRAQIKVESKGDYAMECIEKECVCFKSRNLYSQTTIPCSFYDKIKIGGTNEK